MQFVKTDQNVPHEVPQIVYEVFHKEFPGVLEQIQNESIR